MTASPDWGPSVAVTTDLRFTDGVKSADTWVRRQDPSRILDRYLDPQPVRRIAHLVDERLPAKLIWIRTSLAADDRIETTECRDRRSISVSVASRDQRSRPFAT